MRGFGHPSFVAADLLEPLEPGLARKLRAIRYVSTATLSLGYRRDEFEQPTQWFRLCRAETRANQADGLHLDHSTKFSHRSPDDCVLIRRIPGRLTRNSWFNLTTRPSWTWCARVEVYYGVTARPADDAPLPLASGKSTV